MSILTVVLPERTETIAFQPPRLLSDLLSPYDRQLSMPCGGRGTCGKCRVRAEGMLEAPNAAEMKSLTEEERKTGIRLACQAKLLGDARVVLEQRSGEKIIVDGALPNFPFAPWGKGLGIAVDIGTTTVAAYCYDLQSGERLGCTSAVNPQGVYGADVLSRYGKAEEGLGADLRAAICNCIHSLSQTLCDPKKVQCAVLTGNTAMLTLLCGLSPSRLMRAPFIMDEPFGMEIDPKPFGFATDARVYLPRCISAYVGADITTAIMASGLFSNGEIRKGTPVLLVDIGTNGEMVLCAHEKLYTCSTAAGPAFEGAGIYQGMTAREGAVSAVKMEGGAMKCQVIGKKATGICGSGLVDAVAALLDAGILDETGVLAEEDHDFEEAIGEINDQPAFRLPGTDVWLTQADIRAVQLAKAAIHAGMMTLMEEAGVEPEDVEELIIAGGFGSCISVRSAERIGLIPQGFAKKARAIGNAAGAGAVMTLLSGQVRADTEDAAQRCETVELATNPIFMASYVESMMFE